jgi:hypothetical protein
VCRRTPAAHLIALEGRGAAGNRLPLVNDDDVVADSNERFLARLSKRWPTWREARAESNELPLRADNSSQ